MDREDQRIHFVREATFLEDELSKYTFRYLHENQLNNNNNTYNKLIINSDTPYDNNNNNTEYDINNDNKTYDSDYTDSNIYAKIQIFIKNTNNINTNIKNTQSNIITNNHIIQNNSTNESLINNISNIDLRNNNINTTRDFDYQATSSTQIIESHEKNFINKNFNKIDSKIFNKIKESKLIIIIFPNIPKIYQTIK